MLPAISADLPVYLVPPKARPEDRTQGADSGFGPDTRVDVRKRGGEAAPEHNDTSIGLYGPDGQFVEAAARRTGGTATSNSFNASSRSGSF